MQTSKFTEKIIRYTLGVLLGFLALNAFGGGYYGIAGAKNIPIEWLEGSPFTDYVIPSLFLFIVVGGSALYASIMVFSHGRSADKASLICGIIVLLWLIVQVIIIGYVSWMQPATAVGAILIVLLSRLLLKFNYPAKS
jgi:hypothetical protein